MLKQLNDEMTMYMNVARAMVMDLTDNEEGDAVQWVALILAGLAIVAAVAGIIMSKATSGAQGINLG